LAEKDEKDKEDKNMGEEIGVLKNILSKESRAKEIDKDE